MTLSKEYRVFEDKGIFYRKCKICNEVKNLSEFPIDKTKTHKTYKNGNPVCSVNCKLCFFKDHSKTKRYLTTQENVELLENNLRKCSTCNQVKNISEFWKNGTTTGISSKCAKCDRERKRKTQISSRSRDKEAAKRYNISLEEYDNWINKNPNCNICGIKLEQPHIDHDHNSGKVRGVLCKSCNWGIGHMNDNVDILKSAINYLERTKNQ